MPVITTLLLAKVSSAKTLLSRLLLSSSSNVLFYWRRELQIIKDIRLCLKNEAGFDGKNWPANENTSISSINDKLIASSVESNLAHYEKRRN